MIDAVPLGFQPLVYFFVDFCKGIRMAGIPHHGSIEVGLGNAVFPVNRFNVQHTLITFAVRNLLSHCLCYVEVIKYVFHFGVRYNRIRSFNLTCRQTERQKDYAIIPLNPPFPFHDFFIT